MRERERKSCHSQSEVQEPSLEMEWNTSVNRRQSDPRESLAAVAGSNPADCPSRRRWWAPRTRAAGSVSLADGALPQSGRRRSRLSSHFQFLRRVAASTAATATAAAHAAPGRQALTVFVHSTPTAHQGAPNRTHPHRKPSNDPTVEAKLSLLRSLSRALSIERLRGGCENC